MARSNKGSNRIVVLDVVYRWRARRSEDYGWIELLVWPAELSGSMIHGRFPVGETFVPSGPDRLQSLGDHIVLTNRIVERVIRWATSNSGYDPTVRAKDLMLRHIHMDIDYSDADRVPPVED